ncbi:hypothetical protein BST27_19785 [Mycobacterium intermedium]|uniref:Uncharacterized protein n=1 Tax=Mycobacterium intermedium TaxID=28445 RepID=A0A1E3S774_MYCIE|nr:hypothetical protein [Mycobacterium intermedium]ODQ97979.1 hypothetical protein BHQ20_24375 [Mycobacterium intermedium]OPE46618.1 hypothetical protein BV508_25240 [Mycobacterium intermedium]ORA99149.1 hypothetical protein BST27_19785 [Mycobacterium intermedium]
MLFMHEVHKVRACAKGAFQALFREGWMPMLGASDDARLLWYADQICGSGPNSSVTTITAIQDGVAWDHLCRRIQNGDLNKWIREIDQLRHEVEAKLLVPLPWSPLRDVALDKVPIGGVQHASSIYIEETLWPYRNALPACVERCGELYASSLEGPSSMCNMRAAFQPALVSQLQNEVTLIQRIQRPDALFDLLRTRTPGECRTPGAWMHDALDLREWTRRLLRTSTWSPMW